MAQSLFGGSAPRVDLAGMREAIRAGIAGNVPVYIEGPPGVGKSAIIESIAHEAGLAFASLILSQIDASDIGGIPAVTDKGLIRHAIGPIKLASERPTLLALDEITQAPPHLQGPALNLITSKRAGDVTLHAGSRIVALGNPPTMAAGATDLTAPMRSRFIAVYFAPTVEEVAAHFATLTPLHVDFAATMLRAVELLQVEPPAASVGASQPWGCPRAWDNALRAIDAAKLDPSSPIAFSIMSGSVGEGPAAGFLGYLKLRASLPTAEEIAKDPEHAKVPDRLDLGIAALGLISRVGKLAPASAWIYAGRLSAELATVAYKSLAPVVIPGTDKSPLAEKARKVQAIYLARVGKVIAGK